MNFPKTILFLSFFLLFACPSVVLGQNLVPNPGFEEFVDNGEGFGALEGVESWFNPCKKINGESLGTPDHLFRTSNSSLESFRTYFSPFEGRSVVGVITFLKRQSHYREYISVALTKPLEIGKSYKVCYHISSGDKTTFGKIGTPSPGFLFTTTVPHQPFLGSPINSTRHISSEKIFYKNEWEEICVEFEADSVYKYLTIGNFEDDFHTPRQYYGKDVDPQAYIFIDKVSVKPQEEPTASATIEKEDPTEVPRELEGRKITSITKVKVNNSQVVVKIWDPNKMDGDQISLNFNGEWILKDHVLGRKKRKIVLELKADYHNTLIMFAENLGKIPPNTAKILIKSGSKNEKYYLNSDLNTCSAVQLVSYQKD